MIKVAAFADLHCPEDAQNVYKPIFQKINSDAQLLVIAGDLTRFGKVAEIETLIGELSVIKIPVFAVLGNHDYHSNEEFKLMRRLRESGIYIMDGNAEQVVINGQRIGVVGTKGFGGGFGMRALPEFGEDLLKLFYRTTLEESKKLEYGLEKIKMADIKIAVIHYVPIYDTLVGEPPEIYAFMGSSFFSEAVDRVGADILIHGHTHFGTENGKTPGGIPVRCVSIPMLGRKYAVYEVGKNKHVKTIK